MMPDFVTARRPSHGQHRQAARVRRRGPDRPLEAEHGLEVVVQDVGRASKMTRSVALVALAVGDEHLDARVRVAPTDRTDRLGDRASAAVGEVVAGHRRHDGMREAHLLATARRRGPARSGRAAAGGCVSTRQNPQARVQRSPLIMNVAGAVLPALEDVRASRLLAHRDEVQARIVFRSLRYSSPMSASTRKPGGLRLVIATATERSTPAAASRRTSRPRRADPRPHRHARAQATRPGVLPRVHRRLPRRRGCPRRCARRRRRRRSMVDVDALVAQRGHRPVRDAAGNDVARTST